MADEGAAARSIAVVGASVGCRVFVFIVCLRWVLTLLLVLELDRLRGV